MPRGTGTQTPRKTIYIGNFGVPYSTESHVALSLEALGVEVIRVQENECKWRSISRMAKEVGADWVTWTHTHGFANEDFHERQDAMLDELRDISIPSVAYHLDRWAGLEREHQLAEPYFQCDLVCTADGGHQALFEQMGINHIWMPPAVVHTEVGRGEWTKRFDKQIGFVGSWMAYGHKDLWPWRFDMVAHLHKRYRSRFRAWPRNRTPIRGWELNNLYATVRVIVGDSCLAGNATHYWSDRVPECIGRGGFLLHPRVEGMEEQFPLDLLPMRFEAGSLRSLDEAIEVALSMDDTTRDEWIDRSMEHVRAHHTYLVRMERLIELVDEL